MTRPSRSARSRTGPARSAVRAALVVVLAVGATTGVAACSSPQDDPDVVGRATGDVSPPAVEEPQPARTGLEEPLPPRDPRPALTNAAPGDGTVVLADDRTGACLFYSWVTDGGAPELVDGVTFEVTGAVLSDGTAWRLDATGCPDADCPTLGPGTTACTLGFVHAGEPDPTDLPTVSVAGTLTCGAPLDDDACTQVLAAFAATPGAVLPFGTPDDGGGGTDG